MLQAEASKAWKSAPGHLLLADQAGSGKTLGYLLPLVQEMRQKELKEGRATTSCSPQVVVLTPTTELAQQVGGGAAGAAAAAARVASRLGVCSTWMVQWPPAAYRLPCSCDQHFLAAAAGVVAWQ